MRTRLMMMTGGEQLAYHDTLHKMIEDTPPNVFHL